MRASAHLLGNTSYCHHPLLAQCSQAPMSHGANCSCPSRGNREKELRSPHFPTLCLLLPASSHPLSIPPKSLSILVRVGEGREEQGEKIRGEERREWYEREKEEGSQG